eukprot:6492427-Amphidinium_carterae.1
MPPADVRTPILCRKDEEALTRHLCTLAARMLTFTCLPLSADPFSSTLPSSATSCPLAVL